MKIRVVPPAPILVVACLFLATVAFGLETKPRERQRLDAGWRFHLGDEWSTGQNLAKAGSGFGPAAVEFADRSWREVDLPHDWAVELPFDPRGDAGHGFKAIGESFPGNSVAWYRRAFDLTPADADRRLWLEFDGVYRDCTVFVNGWFVARHESGYTGFRVDITDVANCGGPNVVSVRVDASQAEGWFYEGAGIYRSVWLVKTRPVAIAPDGVFVAAQFPENRPEGRANVRVQTEISSSLPASASLEISWEVRDPHGQPVGREERTMRIDPAATEVAAAEIAVERPDLWSPETPQLYTLRTTLSRSSGEVVDLLETPFGIRTVAFDPERGFVLNGKPYWIEGTCNHQDHAGVGIAVPERLLEFRLRKLKEMGSNAYRTVHHPPAPELLELCDRLGLLVVDENRRVGSDPLQLKWLQDLVRRDRNHPSVIAWSLGNEEFAIGETPAGARVAATMQEAIRRHDPTRPITYNAPVGNVFEGINRVVPVRGWSYNLGANMDAYHAAHPTQANLGTEQASTVSTRGIYRNDPARGYVSAYDDNHPVWANTAEEWLTYFASRPWMSGGFVWTGFDYRGEPTPYAWPCINSHFGIFDTCGFPKDNYWYYKAWWNPEPVLHLVPHWNWTGQEGAEVDVRPLTNCDEVELFLNGRSLGRRAIRRSSHVSWKVPFEAGRLTAVGYTSGQRVAETSLETTGPAAALRLEADRAAYLADGRDVAVVTVSAVDEQGRIVPTAMDAVHFGVRGPGRILGVGNGDPSSHEPDVFLPVPVSRARDLDTWRWKRFADPAGAYEEETRPAFDDSAWAAWDPRSENGPQSLATAGVFRTRFTVSPEELKAPAIELWLGRVEGDGKVYVNGALVGKTSDPRGPSLIDLTPALRPGENVLALVTKVYSPTGGPSRGAQLRVHETPTPPKWQRRVFNGLGQVLLRTERVGGQIELEARAPGLRSATLSLHAEALP